MASNLRDVAAFAGVSTATVSRVVNKVGTVSIEKRQRVVNAIERLQYKPNVYASELGRANGGIPRRRAKLARMPLQGVELSDEVVLR